MATRGFVTSPEFPLYVMCIVVCLLYVNPQSVSVCTFVCVNCHQQCGVSHAQMSHWHTVSACFRTKCFLTHQAARLKQASVSSRYINVVN